MGGWLYTRFPAPSPSASSFVNLTVMLAPVLSFDLPLENLASAVCEDLATASLAYAPALKIDRGVADAELALMVDRIAAVGADAQEPSALALEEDGLFLLRQRLLLELYALGRREGPFAGYASDGGVIPRGAW